jgi:hypothetical protein
MPAKKPRPDLLSQTDFDIWWNDTHFRTIGPLGVIHRLLEKLYKRGATLRQIQEIDTLGKCLIMGDIWATEIDNSLIRRKRSHHAARSFAPLCPDEAFLKAEIEELKVEIERLKAEIEGYRKLLIHAVETEEKGLQEIAQRFQRTPLIPALLEFHVPDVIQHTLSRRGSKLDSWGSFFLLAVTEYMKQELGRPHYSVAYDLLRAYRGLGRGRQFKRSEYAKGKSKTIDRIKKLKRAHPLWADALIPLLLQSQLDRDGIREYRASARAYLERKRAIEPISFMVNRYLEPLGLQLTANLTNT